MNETVVGICETCRFRWACVYHATSEDPVWDCNEYAALGKADASDRARPVVANHDVDPAEGLCANCDHRGDCPKARGEGGIWFCEEYR